MMMNFAVIPTFGERDSLQGAYDHIDHQVDLVIIVQNGHIRDLKLKAGCEYARIPFPLFSNFNLSKAWNLGLHAAELIARSEGCTEWFTAVLNDDAIAPVDWFSKVQLAMAHSGAIAGCSSCPDPVERIVTGNVMVPYTLKGWAFMVRGSSGLRADEKFGWWFGDNDLSWQAARRPQGFVMIPGCDVVNLHPNGSFTPDLHVQASRDAAYFVEKWGQSAW